MISESVKLICSEIGLYYLQKNNGDYEATQEQIEDLRISSIQVSEDGVVTIITPRPGLLIGRRGENIDLLEKHLKTKVRIIEQEDCLEEYIIPRNPDWDVG